MGSIGAIHIRRPFDETGEASLVMRCNYRMQMSYAPSKEKGLATREPFGTERRKDTEIHSSHMTRLNNKTDLLAVVVCCIGLYISSFPPFMC